MPRLLVLVSLLLIPRMALADADAGVAPDHRLAGDVAVKERRWEAAMTEYQAAAEVTPGDAVLQSDLSWVALRAGYFTEAADAARASIAATHDRNLLAASLYNYALALEARQDAAASTVALAAYAWAHVLAPDNRAVAAALAAIMAAFAAHGSFEGDPRQEQLGAGRCARVQAGIEPWESANDATEVEPHCESAAPARGKLPAGLAIVAVNTELQAGFIYQKSWYLLAGRGASWRVLARLGGEYIDRRPQGEDISGYERFTVGAATTTQRGIHGVLALELTHVSGTVGGAGGFAGGGGKGGETTERDVLYCVLDADVRCPVRQSRLGVDVRLDADGAVVVTPKHGAPTRTPLW